VTAHPRLTAFVSLVGGLSVTVNVGDTASTMGRPRVDRGAPPSTPRLIGVTVTAIELVFEGRPSRGPAG
jgi:hypothetical protein